MPETTSFEGRDQTSPRLPSRFRRAQPADVNVQHAFAHLAGSPREALIVCFTSSGGENSAAHVIDLAQPTFDALRRRIPVERTEQQLDLLVRVAKPAAIIARLVDANESDVLKARLVTIVPRLRESYRQSDLIALLGLLATSADSEIRYVVADALAEFGGDEARRLLQILAEDAIPAIRTIAQEHLEELA